MSQQPRSIPAMITKLSHNPDQRDETLLRFIHPSNGNQLLNDTSAPGLAKGLGLKADDGIMIALGKKNPSLELARTMQSADEVAESKDKTGRVYRLRMRKMINGKTFQSRLGLLEDGDSWGLLEISRLFDEIDPSIHASASLVRLQGVCLRSVTVAVPARHFTTPVGQLSGTLASSIRAGNTTKTAVEVTTKLSDAKREDHTLTTSGSGPRESRKRKLAPAALETPIRDVSSKIRWSGRNTNPPKFYKERLDGDESFDASDSDSSDNVVMKPTPLHLRNRSMSDAAYPVVAHRSQDEFAEY